MSYEHLEELRGRRGEKILLFLTVENLVGVIIAALPVYLATQHTHIVLRIALLAIAAAIGYGLTVEVGGLAAYERVLWRARGVLRRRMVGLRITPEQLGGGAQTVRDAQVLALDSPIRALRGRSLRRADGRAVPDTLVTTSQPDTR